MGYTLIEYFYFEKKGKMIVNMTLKKLKEMERLRKQINNKRDLLNELILNDSSDEIVKHSQELDILINEYYRYAVNNE